MAHEIIRQVTTALTPALSEMPSLEKPRTDSDYSTFWSSFTLDLLCRVLVNSFKGNTEEFHQWLENGWQEQDENSNQHVPPEMIPHPLIPEYKYLVSIFPYKEYLQEEENYRSDWKEYRSFYVDVTPFSGRERRPGDRYTVAQVLVDNLELVELQMMGWVGGGVWLDNTAEVLAVSPLTAHFRHGELTRIHTDPDLPEDLERHLRARFNEGPLSDLWFPPPLTQTPSEGPKPHQGLIPKFVLE